MSDREGAVASPALLAARCRSLEEMRLVNFFCRLWEYGGGRLLEEVAGQQGYPPRGRRIS